MLMNMMQFFFFKRNFKSQIKDYAEDMKTENSFPSFFYITLETSEIPIIIVNKFYYESIFWKGKREKNYQQYHDPRGFLSLSPIACLREIHSCLQE